MPPPKNVPGAVDQTRGILQYCDDTFPGCHEEGVKYVTVAGKFLQGIRWGDPGSWQQRIAGQGYKQVRSNPCAAFTNASGPFAGLHVM
jgi:hypothetical protein